MALYDAQLAWLINAATNVLVSGKPPRRMGNRHPNIAPYQTCAAADGTLAVAIGNDAQFARFAALLGRAELAADPRFVSNRARVANVDALEAEIAPLLALAGVSDWVERLTAAGLPAGPVRGVAEVLADPDTAARGMVQTLPAEPGLPPIQLLGKSAAAVAHAGPAAAAAPASRRRPGGCPAVADPRCREPVERRAHAPQGKTCSWSCS